MRAVTIYHKQCWGSPTSDLAYFTVGGFPFQIFAIADIFTETRLMVCLQSSERPPNATALSAPRLEVTPFPASISSDLRRKIAFLTWLPRYLGPLWRSVKRAEAVHALVPGDLGLIGTILALTQRKRLFVRHCGTWGVPVTLTDRYLQWLLQHIARGRNVVMATGGGEQPPSKIPMLPGFTAHLLVKRKSKSWFRPSPGSREVSSAWSPSDA